MSKNRYEGLQNELIRFVPECCFFLTLLSIAEDYKADHGIQPVETDFVGALRKARSSGWLGVDNMMYNDTALLEWLTGAKVTKYVIKPEQVLNIKENEYTAAKYRNGSATHFRRRSYDVYRDSKTVAKGKLEAIYVYSFN